MKILPQETLTQGSLELGGLISDQLRSDGVHGPGRGVSR